MKNGKIGVSDGEYVPVIKKFLYWDGAMKFSLRELRFPMRSMLPRN